MRLSPPSDPRRGKDADDYLSGQPRPLPGVRANKKRVARRPQQPDQSAQAAQLKLDSKLESQAYLLAKNAEGQRPVTKQAQAAIDQRKTTSKAHASDAKRTAVSLHPCPESVASALDAARVARLSDAPDKQRLTPAKRKHDGDYNIRPQN